MPEIEERLTPEHYRAEIAMLNKEIESLNQKLQQKETEREKPAKYDRFDPFRNQTEYKGFSGDYSKVLPEIESPECRLPLYPETQERRNLRRFYSIGGICVLLQFALSDIAMQLLSALMASIISSMNPGAGSEAIFSYLKSGSIAAGLNTLIFLIMNVGFAFLGIKLAGIKSTVLIRTRDFSAADAVQYCLSALFLWVVAVYSATFIEDIFDKFGYTSNTITSDGLARTTVGGIIMLIYSCIIAPITEELFFRGMLLRVLSRANQRFAIFATAVFFGLGHANLPQFVLAFLMGIFLGHITMKHGSIIPAVIVHIFINGMSEVLTRIDDIDNDMVSFVTNMVLIAGAMVGLIMLLVFRSGDKLPATTPEQTKRGLPVAVLSFPLSVSFLIEVFYMIYLIIEKK